MKIIQKKISELYYQACTQYQPIDWLSFFLPPTCPLCRDEINTHGMLCGSCWKNIDFITVPFCHSCGLPFEYDLGSTCLKCQRKPPYWDSFVAAVRYTEHSAPLLTQFKHNGKFSFLPVLAHWLLQSSRPLAEPDYIIPMPINRLRLFWRQFNQAAMLARRLAKLRNSPKAFAPTLLMRKGHNPPQKNLTPAERRENVRDVFYINEKTNLSLKDKHVWLLDDVATTGASLTAATKLLRKAGARVSVLVVARSNAPFPNMH